ATGNRAFTGNTTAVIFDAILHSNPIPASRLNPRLPPELERIIAKATERDRELRYQSAAEVRADLRRLKRESASRGAAAAAAPGKSLRRWAVSLILLLVAALILAGSFLTRSRPQTIDSIAVLPFANSSQNPGTDYLSDGITEGVISTLSQLPQL